MLILKPVLVVLGAITRLNLSMKWKNWLCFIITCKMSSSWTDDFWTGGFHRRYKIQSALMISVNTAKRKSFFCKNIWFSRCYIREFLRSSYSPHTIVDFSWTMASILAHGYCLQQWSNPTGVLICSGTSTHKPGSRILQLFPEPFCIRRKTCFFARFIVQVSSTSSAQKPLCLPVKWKCFEESKTLNFCCAFPHAKLQLHILI